MTSNSKFILAVMLALALIMGIYQGILYAKELAVSQSLFSVWIFVYLVLLVLWVSEDSKSHPNIYKPFEFGYLVFIFYIPYLPYYLIKTKGWMTGLGYLLGFVLLFNVGYIFQWLIYLADV